MARFYGSNGKLYIGDKSFDISSFEFEEKCDETVEKILPGTHTFECELEVEYSDSFEALIRYWILKAYYESRFSLN